MARLQLLGGTYLARSLIASVEQCDNLYPEKNQQPGAAAPFTYLLTPGLTLKHTISPNAPARGMYTATNGSLYYVAGNTLYFISSTFNISTLGTLGTATGPVFMQDNGNVLVIVDGTRTGYAVNLQTGIEGEILSFFMLNPGSGGTAGVYTLALTGGSGSGATVGFTVAGGTITQINIVDPGTNYAVNDQCGIAAGSGLSNFGLVVTAVGAQVNAFAQINDPNFLGGTGIGYVDTFLVLSQPNSRNFYSSLSNITYAELVSGTSGGPQLGEILAAGSGGTPGTYSNATLTGGSGTGITATVVIGGGGAVTSIALNGPGTGYNAGDILSTNAGSVAGVQYELVQVNNAAFDPTYVAAKTGYPDLLATLVTVHREIWLMGSFESTEVWYDAGGTTFPFQIMPGVYLQHGCIAPASVATHDLVVFWLGVDNAGQGTVFMGSGYTANRISTWAIANMISGFLTSAGTISDAVGLVYKQQDHVFYVLSFPTANATLVYDLTENQWHTRSWLDPNAGTKNRVRYNVAAQCYGLNVVADWQNGNIYTLDLMNYTDNGTSIVRTRSFAHILNDGKRQSYDRFSADLQCGQGYPSAPMQKPLITLEISDDRGQTYYTAPLQSMGEVGKYFAQPQWRQLGIARDRVFRLSWSEGVFTALQGAWLDATPAET